MRFTRIEAIGVGPLADQVLELAPGLNVVHGLNEAGKSSWHAAIIVGWLGQRRGRGAGRGEDRAFRDRFEPWSGAPLIAAVEIVTDDGERFRIRHNLTDLADNTVTDGLGHDVTSTWEQDGAADGAQILGLGREAAVATLSVSQAQILAIRDGADDLQADLQRAAATAGRTSSTANDAINRIDTFVSDHVGTLRAHTRPLARSKARLDEAAQVLADAQDAHERYQEFVAVYERAQADLARLESQRDGARDALESAARSRALHELDELRDLQAQIAELSAGPAPAEPAVIEQVDRLLQRFADRPEPIDVAQTEVLLAGLEQRLDELPDMPNGDTTVDAAVDQAAQAWQTAASQRDFHAASQPGFDEAPSVDLAPAVIERHATLLEQAGWQSDLAAGKPPLSHADPGGVPKPAGHTGRGWQWGGAVVATGATVAAVVAVVAGELAIAAVGAGVAVASALAGWVLGRRARGAAGKADSGLVADAGVDQRRLQAAVGELREAGVESTDPSALRELAEQIRRREHLAATRATWDERDAALRQALEAAEARLTDALTARGVAITGDVSQAYPDYRSACQRRSEQARHAEQRPLIEQQIAVERRTLEDAQARNAQRCQIEDEVVARAGELVGDAGGADGLETADAIGGKELDATDQGREGPEAAAIALRAWRAQQAERVRRQHDADVKQASLEARLGGRSIGEIAEQLEGSDHHDAGDAARSERSHGGEDPATARRRLEQLDQDVTQARRAADLAGRDVANLAERITPVSEAEEDHARASADHERLVALGDVLAIAREHLERANRRVNQDLAPVLRQAVARHLPRLTRGRYQDVQVNPAELSISVRSADGRDRPATGLSLGTAEQMYLLLRIGLAEHLVTTGETAPLILDDATVQFDEHRTVAFLDLCLELAADRQIVVFTQEREVLEWAEQHLDGEHHRLECLADPHAA